VNTGPQLRLFETTRIPRKYHDAITATANLKGCMDVDTVKGCTAGMSASEGGCYGECYAYKIASRYGIAFGQSIARDFVDRWQHRDILIDQLRKHPLTWYRIGVMGDPSHDWSHTLRVIRQLTPAEKTAVIVTKHWRPLTDDHVSQLLELDAIVQTSTSGLDSDAQIHYRVEQWQRLRRFGIRSLHRVVTCRFGESEWARACHQRQAYLLSLGPVIDTPLRMRSTNPRLMSGEILAEHRADSVGGGKLVSVNDPCVYLGRCETCPDQCGAGWTRRRSRYTGKGLEMVQRTLFTEPSETETSDAPAPDSTVEFRYVPKVTGSGFEAQVAALALDDGIAHRAARKNMQIHSAIILLISGEFSGFFTFQDNRTVGEFCLLQSVITPALYTPDLYRRMAEEVIKRNEANLPMLMTTNPKSRFETPAVFNRLGFTTYLKASGFEYMLAGDDAYHRLKTLAHITMTNVWNSTSGDWIRLKKEWNERLAEAGEVAKIPNPTFATREGCWQGESGFANVVTGRSHNGNASVLDPVACEVIVRMFMPLAGKRIYNPFGGGVQCGFVSGASGYEYLATEIRQNQCDANNALCAEFPSVRWVQADSTVYDPDGDFDLVFSCPPYYRIERYVDYDGSPPPGEINTMKTYTQFRDALFTGYGRAIAHLKNNRFAVFMTGDSRGPHGGYYGHESETELFLRTQGLIIYNKIIYLEAEFTRLAQAKKTLMHRKFPKREQRIIVAYKGDVDRIADEFPPIGRL
jgi:hypothetical protein